MRRRSARSLMSSMSAPGPNLIPLFCALPRARSLTVWEYAESNVAWLEAEMLRDEMRPQWRHFWDVTRHAYRPECRLPDDPMSALRAKSDCATGLDFRSSRARMGRRDHVLLRGIDHRAARRIRSGMRRLCALRKARRCFGRGLPRALGRICRGRTPISGFVCIRRVDQSTCLRAMLTASRLKRIGIVERQVRSGYSGFVFLSGSAR